jgi:hypothetical protein
LAICRGADGKLGLLGTTVQTKPIIALLACLPFRLVVIILLAWAYFPKLDNVPVISSHGSRIRAGGCLVVMLTASGLPPKDCQLFRREIQEIRDALQVFQTGG